MVGNINRPDLASALLAIPLKAVAVFPALAFARGPTALTYPVMRKKRATAARSLTSRRKKGSCKICDASFSPRAGACMKGMNAVHRWPVTTVKAAMPRRP